MFFTPKRIGVDYILSVLNIEIPQYKIISKEEVWSDYCDYKISFPTDYSASIIKQFETWEKKEGVQIYDCQYDETHCSLYCTDNTPGDYHYWTEIDLQEGTAHVWMSFEFGEQIECVIFICIFAFMGLVIGLIYGMIILAVKVSNSISARKRPKDNQT